MVDENSGRSNGYRHFVSFFVVLVVLGLGIGIGTLISYRVVAVGPGDSQLKIPRGSTTPASGAAQALSQAFEEVAKRVGPSVVNINTEEVVGPRTPRSGRNNQQLPDFWQQLMPDMPQQYTVTSLGSGIIVDPKGYIVTNNHVVQSASKIKVTLKDGKEYKARVIAGDNLSDIAVIKIDGDKDFPAAKIGDAKAMKVGDWVLAVGSPFRTRTDRHCRHCLCDRPRVRAGTGNGDAFQRLPADGRIHQSRQQRRSAGKHERRGHRHQQLHQHGRPQRRQCRRGVCRALAHFCRGVQPDPGERAR